MKSLHNEFIKTQIILLNFKTKNIMETLKNKIANLAQTQSDLKNQRKTVNLIGERTTSSSEVQWMIGNDKRRKN